MAKPGAWEGPEAWASTKVAVVAVGSRTSTFYLSEFLNFEGDTTGQVLLS
jgi:hypothetical protein